MHAYLRTPSLESARRYLVEDSVLNLLTAASALVDVEKTNPRIRAGIKADTSVRGILLQQKYNYNWFFINTEFVWLSYCVFFDGFEF